MYAAKAYFQKRNRFYARATGLPKYYSAMAQEQSYLSACRERLKLLADELTSNHAFGAKTEFYIDVLTWLAYGRKQWEVAEQFGISRQAVAWIVGRVRQYIKDNGLTFYYDRD